jgi:hypothetical protein
VHATTGDALNDFFVVDSDFNHGVQFDTGFTRASAWGMVRGKPSNRKPLTQSAERCAP